jgi:hexosaminidase
LSQLDSIIVDEQYQNAVDEDGETLIPPTLLSFSQTFSEDLLSTLKLKVPVVTGKSAEPKSIFITLGDASAFLDAAGRPTSEGYEIQVTDQGILVIGASPLGAWWGTRTILQQGVLSDNLQLTVGNATDAPGWGIRGAFVRSALYYICFRANRIHSSTVGDTTTRRNFWWRCVRTFHSLSKTLSISI